MYSVNIDKLMDIDSEKKESLVQIAHNITEALSSGKSVAVIGGKVDTFRIAYSIMEAGNKVLFVDGDIIRRGYETVREYKACVAGMPCKDTIKLVDEDECTVQTPKRKYVRAVQTPQVFETSLIIEAYSRLMREDSISVTDDGMVVEQMMNVPVKLYEGSYENIKITTPEDLEIPKVFLYRKK